MRKKSKDKFKASLIIALFLAVTCGFAYLVMYGYGAGHILSAQNIDLGLDLRGGVSILYEADLENPTTNDMEAAEAMIRQRLDSKGYTDAEVSIANGNRLSVEIPGVEDANEAINSIGASAQLSFMDMNGNVYLTGEDVAEASVGRYQNPTTGIQEIQVILKFTEEGKQKFFEATTATVGAQLLIMLDNNIISMPSVSEPIQGDSATISGNFTDEEARELAELINAGALPFKLNVISSEIVGAKLGADALTTSIKAGLYGFVAVLIFMLVIYRGFGFISSLALAMFITMEMLTMNALNLTLTLPGIAGIILSIGMAVDANVIIFERIKEEIREGRTLRVATRNGYRNAFSAILDGNVTTLIAAVILFYLGTGPIKGFAQTLGIGILISMFTALVITRILTYSLIELGVTNKSFYGVNVKSIKEN